MRKLFNLVFMNEAEYFASLVRTSVDDDKTYLAGFNAGKFHASGGYGKSLVATKAKLKDAQEQIAKYRPIAEIFQPSEALTALLQDVNGVSDTDAAADSEIVGHQARRERT